MNEQDELLTPEERHLIRKDWWNRKGHKFNDLIDMSAKAQLAKVKPIIEKAERERITSNCEDVGVAFDEASVEYALLRMPKSFWQTLKEGK